MKFIARFLILTFAAVALAPDAAAVTKGEMDKAQAITAKYYLRFANNGAGYLDEVSPESLADLEKALTNNTDRENLKAFRSASVAGDYAGWNKDQLVAYWSGEFLNANKSVLKSDAAANGLCRKQIKTAVQAMKVTESAPQPEAEPATEPELKDPVVEEELALQAEMDRAGEELNAEEEAIAEDTMPFDEPAKKSSGTWVYIMILAILVAVVIFLVVYASRTMKGRPARRESNEEAPVRNPEEEAQREKYADTIAEKNDEIRVLSRRVNELTDKVAVLRADNERLKAELLAVTSASASVRIQEEERYMPKARPAAPAPEESYEEEETDRRVIFLGRVNSRGVFVRADRTMKPGMSVYRLTTNNGLTGTFSVVNDPSVMEVASEDPGKWLVGGCMSKDIFNIDGYSEIRTETPGTAVFEDGAWRVIRKAKIKYE